VYRIEVSVSAKEDIFTYRDGMQDSWQAVKSGTILGKYGSGASEITSTGGMLLFPKAPEKIKVGRNLYYIANLVRSR
jgi:hypothetical protein